MSQSVITNRSFELFIAGESAVSPSMIPASHDDLTAQHYQHQHHQQPPQLPQQYQGYACAATPPGSDFPTGYGPMYSSYMKCRTNPYQRPNGNGVTGSVSGNVAASGTTSNALPNPAMYYPGFSNAAAAAATAAAGLYSRQHNMYDYTTASAGASMHHHAEVPR